MSSIKQNLRVIFGIYFWNYWYQRETSSKPRKILYLNKCVFYFKLRENVLLKALKRTNSVYKCNYRYSIISDKNNNITRSEMSSKLLIFLI